MPASGATTTTIRLFDAAYNDSINASSGAGPAADQGGTFTSGNGFTTTYQLYKQNNPLDFTDRTVVGSCPSLSVQAQTSYAMTWTNLCTITPSNGETYLLNVKSTSSGGNSAGANGYALEAVAARRPGRPAATGGSRLRRHGHADPEGWTGTASFYLAEVGPQHAGKTLVVQLYDAGDFSGGVATVRPLMPKTGTAPTLSWTSVARRTAPTRPRQRRTPSSAAISTPNDHSPAISSRPARRSPTVRSRRRREPGPGNATRRFNDSWLTIKIDIPTNYTCTEG